MLQATALDILNLINVMFPTQGDSGGPMQYPNDYDGQYRLVGVTSFGRGCGTAMPGVYTRVAYYINWIENIVWPAGLNTWTS